MIFAGSGSDKVDHSRPKRQLVQFSFQMKKNILFFVDNIVDLLLH